MAGVVATEMLARDVPAKNKARSVMATKGKFRAAYEKRYGKKAANKTEKNAPAGGKSAGTAPPFGGGPPKRTK